MLGVGVHLARPRSSVYEPSVDGLFARMATQPDATRKALIAAAIASMKTEGIWPKLDVLWVMAAHDSQAAHLNWKAPGRYTLTPAGSPTFAADEGYTGNGSSARIATGYNPLTHGVAYSLNSAHLGAWIRTTASAEAVTDVGSSANLRIDSRRAADVFLGRVNNSNNVTGANATEGYFCVNRSASNALQFRKNNTSLSTSSEASTAISNSELFILALAAAGTFSSKQISIVHAGGSLSTSEIDALYGIFDTYMAGL